jgi:hypothetical protein
VSTAPSSSVASSVTVTAMGYVYLMVSVIAYALYEVSSKWSFFVLVPSSPQTQTPAPLVGPAKEIPGKGSFSYG